MWGTQFNPQQRPPVEGGGRAEGAGPHWLCARTVGSRDIPRWLLTGVLNTAISVCLDTPLFPPGLFLLTFQVTADTGPPLPFVRVLPRRT